MENKKIAFYLYLILYPKITQANSMVIALAIATGKSLDNTPYVNHKNVPNVKKPYISKDIPEVSLVRMVLIACGKKETVVPKAAI